MTAAVDTLTPKETTAEQPRILLVEDEPLAVKQLERFLGRSGFSVFVAADGERCLEMAREQDFDVIILDLRLPRKSGLDVCEDLRNSSIDTPILMLTGLDNLQTKVTGLRIGADDYVTKPVALEELLARIQALLRPGRRPAASPKLTVGDITLDRKTREATIRKRTVGLSPKEFAVLELLVSRAGKVLTRKQILQEVWGDGTDPNTNLVEVYIRFLRKKIDVVPGRSLIQTIRGVGYRIVVE